MYPTTVRKASILPAAWTMPPVLPKRALQILRDGEEVVFWGSGVQGREGKGRERKGRERKGRERKGRGGGKSGENRKEVIYEEEGKRGKMERESREEMKGGAC